MFSIIVVVWNLLRFGCGNILLPKAEVRFLVKKSCRDKRTGERLCEFLENMGPSFIKFGQLLSMRADLLGEEVTADLARLRDNLEPFSIDLVRREIEEAFNKPVEEMFEEFCEEPVSTASVAQVHKAKFQGEWVAIKILSPNVKERFARDMRLFRSLHKLASVFFSKRIARLSIDKVLDIFSSTIERETNLLMEAAAAHRLRKESKNLPHLKIPRVVWGATSEKCLTMEWMDGLPLESLEGQDKKLASEILMHTLFHQAIRNGFFHGDLHSGNIFFDTEKKEVIFVDFGIVGWLSMGIRVFLVKVFKGSLEGDYKMVATAHKDMHMFQKPVCMETFTLACTALISPLAGLPAKDISCAKLLSRLMQTAEMFQVRLQPELLLLHRTLISAEGIARQMNPDINVWSISSDVIEGWIKENHKSLGALKNKTKKHIQKMIDLLNWIEGLPDRN